MLAACFHCDRVQLAYEGQSGKLILHRSKIYTTEGALRNRFSHAVPDAKMRWGITISNLWLWNAGEGDAVPSHSTPGGGDLDPRSTCGIGPLDQSNTHARGQHLFIIKPT